MASLYCGVLSHPSPRSAAATGNLPILDALLRAGADPLAANGRQQTALYAAIHNGHAPCVRRLLAVCPQLVQPATVEQWSALHVACINGSVDIARTLIEHPYPEAVLRAYACDGGHCRLPFDPNAPDITGQTPLYVACLLGNAALVQLLFDWRVPVVRPTAEAGDLLASAGTTPSTTTPSPSQTQTSPSKRRVSMGIQSIMDRLYLVRDGSQDKLSPFADEPDACGAAGDATAAAQLASRCPLQLDRLCGAPRETALLAAVRGGYAEVVALLLAAGADPNVIARPLDEEGQNDELYGFSNSPLAEATRQTAVEILDLLLR